MALRCHRCGAGVPDNKDFCFNCGACANCGLVKGEPPTLTAPNSFCPICGEELWVSRPQSGIVGRMGPWLRGLALTVLSPIAFIEGMLILGCLFGPGWSLVGDWPVLLALAVVFGLTMRAIVALALKSP